MTEMKTRGRIVVGVDGSDASAAAVCWAVWKARLRHAAVHLVCACDDAAVLGAPDAPPSKATRADECYAAAEAILATAAELARPHLPPGRLTTELAHELPVQALLDRVADAEMLVLGTTRFPRGSGPPPAMGPVARDCLRLARGPVVVIASEEQHAEAAATPAMAAS